MDRGRARTTPKTSRFTYPKTCPKCGTAFTTADWSRVYCDDCRRSPYRTQLFAASRRDPATYQATTCGECGKEFKAPVKAILTHVSLRCPECKDEHRRTNAERNDLRRHFRTVLVLNPNEAAAIVLEMVEDEGPDFTRDTLGLCFKDPGLREALEARDTDPAIIETLMAATR